METKFCVSGAMIECFYSVGVLCIEYQFEEHGRTDRVLEKWENLCFGWFQLRLKPVKVE